MGSGNKMNFALMLIFLVVIITFAYSYNTTVTSAIADSVDNDRVILQEYNNDIIKKLTDAENTSQWETIIDEYDDIIVSINDSSNKLVVKNSESDRTALDIRERSAFEFCGEAYLITSSIYLLRDYTINKGTIIQLAFVELFIVIAVFCFLVLIIYAIMIRPYRAFYQAVEEYEQTGKFKKRNFKGYIGKVYNKFSLMTDNLEQQQNNQQRIIASISHDIKTPLTSIMGYSEQLRKDNLTEERRKRYIDKLYNKSLEIRGLVDEFDEYLSYDMIKSTRTEKISTTHMCTLITDECAEELERFHVDFEVNNYARNSEILIDVPKMRRVFGNIISNSLKHFKDAEKKIRVDVKAKNDIVQISISDNGCGVEEDKLELIFEPLYTSDKGRKVAGLGLAICHDIVESHGGIIYADQSDMGGLAIYIELKDVH
ncbi:MAG: HAMP domain-containing histidine kinase [Faecalibacterium sp.]|nr:HAMP domain-containing histidine kinase [Ruminococcus flavefaciens]MCM1392037.1 HAMP domain-containing histidine kinase [Ruminococcus sp.]MCM1484844.1 HAMP domain-containing histidine kinase [Faecalibacterium sp.]